MEKRSAIFFIILSLILILPMTGCSDGVDDDSEGKTIDNSRRVVNNTTNNTNNTVVINRPPPAPTPVPPTPNPPTNTVPPTPPTTPGVVPIPPTTTTPPTVPTTTEPSLPTPTVPEPTPTTPTVVDPNSLTPTSSLLYQKADRIVTLSKDLTKKSTTAWHPRDIYRVRRDYEFPLISETVGITNTQNFTSQMNAHEIIRDKVRESLIYARKSLGDFRDHMDDVVWQGLQFVGNDQFFSEQEFVSGLWINEFMPTGYTVNVRNSSLLPHIDNFLNAYESRAQQALTTNPQLPATDQYVQMATHENLAFVYLRAARDIADFQEIGNLVSEQTKTRLVNHENVTGRDLRTKTWQFEGQKMEDIISEIHRIENYVRNTFILGL